jgi:hypothetical protein
VWDSQEINMILTIHNLAENYKCLPTEAMARATTFDLYVLDVHTKWLKYQHEQEKARQGQGKTKGQVFKQPRLSQEQLKAMMERSRSGK